MEITRENGNGEYDDIDFQIYDYVRDIRDILNELHNSFEKSWDIVFNSLKEFIEINNRFPLTDEKYDGVLLGQWCKTQRQLYAIEKLPQDRIDKLNSIGFVWRVTEENWISMFEKIKEYKAKVGEFPAFSNPDDEIHTMYLWIVTQKVAYKVGKLTDERQKLLDDIGLEYKVADYDLRWEKNFQAFEEFVKKHGRVPNCQDTNTDETIKIYQWYVNQRAVDRAGKLSDDRKARFDALNIKAKSRYDIKWDEQYDIMLDFINEFHRLPKHKERYRDGAIGSWFTANVTKFRNGKLTDDQAKRFLKTTSDMGYSLERKKKT